jgi:hypothetical protein
MAGVGSEAAREGLIFNTHSLCGFNALRHTRQLKMHPA